MTHDPRPRPLVPLWLERLGAVGWRVLVIVGLALVVAFIAAELATVTISILVALLVAAVLVPIVRRLRRRGVAPTVASAVAFGFGLLIAIVGLLLVVAGLLPDVTAIVSAIEAGIRALRADLIALGAPTVVIEAFDRLVVAVLDAIAVRPTSLVGPVASVVTVLVLGGFLTFFLLADGERAWASAMARMEPWRADAIAASAVGGLERVSGYLRRTALLAVVDALVLAIVLALLGVPLVGALAVLVLIGGFIPYLGAIVTGAVVTIVSLAWAGEQAALIVLIALVATHVVATRVLEPTGLGSAVDVHPVLVLVAIPAGAALLGLLGLFVLLPVTVFVLAVSRSVIVALDIGPGARTTGAGTDGIPTWLERLAQWSWRGLVIVGLAALAVRLAVSVPGVVVPAVFAVVLAATLGPLAGRLRAMGWSRGLAAGAATIGAALAVTAAAVGSIFWTAGPLRDIAETALDGAEAIDLEWLEDVIASIGSGLIVDIAGLLRALVGLSLALTLALLLTFFFLRDGPALWRLATRRMRGYRRDRIDVVAERSVGVLSGYMVGTALISLFGAVTSWLILVVLGLPLAVPIGVLTFFGGFIPYIGSFVTTALAALVAVAVGSTTDVIVMAIFTVVFNVIQGNFVTPLVYGRTLSLHPAIILLAIPAGSEVAGILGMFLVVPFVAIVASTWRAALDAIAGQPEGESTAEVGPVPSVGPATG